MPRTKVVVFGNCQAQTVAQALAQMNDLEVYYHFVVMREEQSEEWARQIAFADLVLVQDVTNWENYPFQKVAETKQVVKFPFVHFAALWPFDGHQNGNDDVVIAKQERTPPSMRFAFNDSLLARLRTEEPDPEKRFLTYRDLSHQRSLNIKRYFEMEKLRLRSQDARHNSAIGEFIIQNFQDRPLFHAITHPNAELTFQLLQSICRSANLTSIPSIQNVRVDTGGYEVPLHPRVADELDIRWVTPETRYRFYDSVQSFESYYRAYIFVYG
jgi:hypothetical protein